MDESSLAKKTRVLGYLSVETSLYLSWGVLIQCQRLIDAWRSQVDDSQCSALHSYVICGDAL